MKKKNLLAILCLLLACGLIMLGIFFMNDKGYVLNNDNDFIAVMEQMDSSFQGIKQIDRYDYENKQIKLKLFAVVDQKEIYHFFVFQQRYHGKYDMIYNYSRAFEMAYCLRVRNTDLVVLGMPNYDGSGKKLEVLVENNLSFFENINQEEYIMRVYDSNNHIVTAFLCDAENNSIDCEMIFADIGGN